MNKLQSIFLPFLCAAVTVIALEYVYLQFIAASAIAARAPAPTLAPGCANVRNDIRTPYEKIIAACAPTRPGAATPKHTRRVPS